jgi:very-short-patch-repair endonuclease
MAKKGVRLSEEHKYKLSLAHKGKPSYRKGKTYLELYGKERSQKIKIMRIVKIRGKHHTDEHKKKLSLANKGSLKIIFARMKQHPEPHLGKKHTDKTKNSISSKMQGRLSWNIGKKGIYSAETLQKMRTARLKHVCPLKDTKPEIEVQNALKQLNIDFKKHFPILGQPDIFIEPNICIFVDGVYWHFNRQQIIRDTSVTRRLEEQGYVVYRFWDDEILNG